MTNPTYQSYLDSPRWKARAKRYKERQPHCSLCHRSERLHVHHNTYERLGHERAGDVTVLCSDCHRQFHENHKYSWKEQTYIPSKRRSLT